MNDHFRAGFTGACGGFVIRSIIDNENVIELLARAAHDIANVLLFLIRRNDRRD